MSRTFNNVLDKHEMVCYYVPTRHICCIGGEQRMKISVLKIETLLAEKSMTKADLANRCGITLPEFRGRMSVPLSGAGPVNRGRLVSWPLDLVLR